MNEDKAIRFCAYCGVQMRTGANFCSACGEKVTTIYSNNNNDNPADEQDIVNNNSAENNDHTEDEDIAPTPMLIRDALFVVGIVIFIFLTIIILIITK